MTNTHKIIQGDCIAGMRTMPDGSVQTCITSPPYFGLRDYGTGTWEGGDDACDHKDDDALAERLRQRKSMISVGERTDGSTRTRVHDEQIGKEIQYSKLCKKCGAKRVDSQIGQEDTVEGYVQKMVEVFREIRRILRDDGTVWLNLGDSYMSLNGCSPAPQTFSKDASDGQVKDFVPPNHKNQKGLKKKDLIGIPWRVAFALQADGWYLRQDIIWSKPNPMPESVTDRCTKSHEYIFLLSKNKQYYFDHESIKESAVGNPHAPGNKNLTQPKNKGSRDPALEPDRVWASDGKRNKRSVWTITTKPFRGAHFATFPKDLITPCVLAGTSEHGCCSNCGAPWERKVETSRTFESGSGRSGTLPKGKNGKNLQGGGETKDIRMGSICHSSNIGWEKTCKCVDATVVPCTVFDPFTGSGTTAVVALQHGRNFIGTELNPEYIKIAEARITEEVPNTLQEFIQ